MNIIYFFIRKIIDFGLRFYYNENRVEGKENINLSVPTIVISNHPNTMFDVMVGVRFIPKVIKFLANASLFKTPFNRWFFSTFYCIPVERPQDTGTMVIDNSQAFVAAIDYLSKGGMIYIAPEGSSYLDRQLLELKTGTARIAFQTLEKLGFGNEVHILPIGINYSRPHRWGGSSHVTIGKPLKVSEWMDSYQYEPYETVRLLTEKLYRILGHLTINAADLEEEKILCALEHSSSQPFEAKLGESFLRSKLQLKKIKSMRENEAESYMSLKEISLDQYHRAKLDLDLFLPVDIFTNVSNQALRATFWVVGIAFAPIFFLLYLWRKLISTTIKKTGLYIGYHSTAKFWISAFIALPVIFIHQWLFQVVFKIEIPFIGFLFLHLLMVLIYKTYVTAMVCLQMRRRSSIIGSFSIQNFEK